MNEWLGYHEIYDSWISLLKEMYDESYPFCVIHDSRATRYLHMINLIIKAFCKYHLHEIDTLTAMLFF